MGNCCTQYTVLTETFPNSYTMDSTLYILPLYALPQRRSVCVMRHSQWLRACLFATETNQPYSTAFQRRANWPTQLTLLQPSFSALPVLNTVSRSPHHATVQVLVVRKPYNQLVFPRGLSDGPTLLHHVLDYLHLPQLTLMPDHQPPTDLEGIQQYQAQALAEVAFRVGSWTEPDEDTDPPQVVVR